MDFKRPERCQRQRTGREDRHSKFYEVSDNLDWDDPGLFLLLALTAVILNRVSVDIGPMRFSGEGPILVLAIALLGLAPAVAIGVLVVLVDQGYAGRRPAQLWDAAAYATCSLAGAVAFRALSEQHVITPLAGSLPIAVLVLALGFDFVNFGAVALHKSAAHGTQLRATFMTTFVPMFPWNMVGAGLAAAMAHAYYTLGIGAVAALGLLLVSSRLLMLAVAKADQRARQLEIMTADRDRLRLAASEVEEQERRRIGEALHDDAVQSLLAARQDVIALIGGDPSALKSAQAGLGESVSKLRGILGALHLPGVSEVELVDALELLAVDVRERTGLEVDLGVRVGRMGECSALSYGIVRELLANVATHAVATTVRVGLVQTADAVRIEVVDDGVGVAEEAVTRAPRQGHLGLELLRRRVAGRGGDLALRSDRSGTTVTVRLPVPTDRVADTAAEHAADARSSPL